MKNNSLIALLILISTICGPELQAEEDVTSILCVGDSITAGSRQFSVYREPLAQKLKDAGYEVTFVGPKSSVKNGVRLGHAGYGGKNTEFLNQMFDEIYREYPADILLLHSAHNHFHDQKPVYGIIASLTSIIKKARTTNPEVTVLLATGITSGKLPKYSYIPELNKQMKLLGKRLNTPSQPVVIVDQAKGFNWETDTVADKVHPNAKGAEKMAVKWIEALKPILEVKPAANNAPD